MQHTAQQQADYPVNERGRAYAPVLADDDKTWSMLAHLSLLGHLIVPPFAIIAPIIIYMTKKDQSGYVADHAAEAINFQITLMIYTLIAGPLALLTCGLGAVLAIVVVPLGIVGMVLAAVASNRGEFFRYPMTFRFIH